MMSQGLRGALLDLRLGCVVLCSDDRGDKRLCGKLLSRSVPSVVPLKSAVPLPVMSCGHAIDGGRKLSVPG